MTPAETVSAILASVIQDAKQTVINEVRAQVLKNEIEKLKRQIRQEMEEDFRKTTRDRLLQCMWRCTILSLPQQHGTNVAISAPLSY